MGPLVPAVLSQFSESKREFPDIVGWFTQVFVADRTYQGILADDICFGDTPEEVLDLMYEKTMMQVRLDKDLKAWFKRYAQEQDTTMCEIIRRYLRQLQARHVRNSTPEDW
jgi:hypothetical protein